jgi:hypothetical protein
VERLPVRYAAIVCIAVSGMFMGGAGAVAFATPGSDGGDGSNSTGADGSSSTGGTQNTGTGGTQNTGTNSTVGGFRLPKLLPGLGNSPFKMNLPQWLGPSPSSPSFADLMLPGPATPGLATAPLAPFTVGAPDPAGQRPALQTSDDTSRPANLSTADPGKQSPAVSLLPLVSPGVPVGQPVTIDNPLPEQLPIDLNNPIVPQLLPPPVVVILMAAAEQVPLAGLVITPVLDAKVPPFLADVVIPALLSDIVVPTLPLGTVSPATTVPDVASLANLASFPKPAGGSLPPELRAMGMDVPQAPELTPAPPTVEPPHWTSPSSNDVTALSAPVAFRAGYSDYLRNAGTAQITAIAVPGAAAILLFTVGGGFIGYRQARAGHVIRAEGMTRFLR